MQNSQQFWDDSNMTFPVPSSNEITESCGKIREVERVLSSNVEHNFSDIAEFYSYVEYVVRQSK